MLVFVVLPLLDEDAELEGFKFLFEGVSFRNASFTILLVQVVGGKSRLLKEIVSSLEDA